MKLIETSGNLFDFRDTHDLVHCVSADFKLGAGIALEFAKYYDMREKLQETKSTMCPSCIYIDSVFNLVTKEKYFEKPTYESLRKSLEIMRDMNAFFDEEDAKCTRIAMPRIGCGLDKLNWVQVKKVIEDVFKDDDIEITVVEYKQPGRFK